MLRRARATTLTLSPEEQADHAPKGEAVSPLAERFHPERLSVSGKFCAILGYIFNEEWTDLTIAEMMVTSDSMVLARHTGDCGFNEFVGGEFNLVQNLNGVAVAVELTPEETEEFLALARLRIPGLTT